jgi:DNA helicase-2/ATP-dependent DNA helicase PcrA
VPINPAQIAAAEQQQWQAAKNAAAKVRLVAGPGTGKSATIERRVAHLLNSKVNPKRIRVISFTRVTGKDLEKRILKFCNTQPCANVVDQVRVSTMHSFALGILRAAAVLAMLYPSDPVVLDDWEQENIYDSELANVLGCSVSRASEIRIAHDAHWQTLNPEMIAQAAITEEEKNGFITFHHTRRNLYCCVLPGEVIFECVRRMQLGEIKLKELPKVEHLIVDEFQDLNACDQEFVRLIVEDGANVFVAGDDDQSIYSFRHANPAGIIEFDKTYPGAVTKFLDACFRCTPAILETATALIAHNPNRLPKAVVSLYANSTPPVQGRCFVWSFASAQVEAVSIARSCQALIAAGKEDQEDEIIILISNRRLQLGQITQELANLGIPFDSPTGAAIRDEAAIRAAYSILRIFNDLVDNDHDYVAYRALLAQLYGIGPATGRTLGDLCVKHNQNFRDLFHLNTSPNWLTGARASAVARVQAVMKIVAAWKLEDTIESKANEIHKMMGEVVFAGSTQSEELLQVWDGFVGTLPTGMTLDELLLFLGANDEAEQLHVLDATLARLGLIQVDQAPAQKRVRILTMHGAKGLSGKIVFIPSMEQGILPNSRGIHAVGLLNEQRRLFYVSLTRAKAACIISHASLHTGPQAFILQQRPQARLPRSQFLNEMGVPSTNRANGLTLTEVAQIMSDINNL